jgi:hypothetical protein
MKVRSVIKIQVNNFTTRRARDDFLAMSQAEKDKIFPEKEPAHEFNTFGRETFGASAADSYKGLEQSGKLFLFGYRGSGEQLREIMVEYRHVPEHGQVVKEEISALDYFNNMLNDLILPALQSCIKK